MTDKQTLITPLQAALNEINGADDDFKDRHLSPSQWKALRDRIAHLEYELGVADVTIDNLNNVIAHMEAE